MVDPLGWWPGKYAECKRIAQLVAEFLPCGEVLESGGPGIFTELLPDHRITAARLADGVDLCRLPYADDCFDVGVSARVVELLPPHRRQEYVLELLRVCRYRIFVALPLQPELEAIDKIKNSYIWGTSRVWQHPGPRPEDLERLLESRGVCLAFHAECPSSADLALLEASRELLDALLAVPSLGGRDTMPALPTPPFVVAEISKLDVLPPAFAGLSQAAH